MGIPVIGLTGQSGAGKSTVSARLAFLGFFIIDGDLIAREVVQKGSPVIEKLACAFGKDIILEGGSLDRSLLAKKAFSTPENTEILNSITHPPIAKKVCEKIDFAVRENYRAALIDAAALLESEIAGFCDIIVSVIAPLEVRLERIRARDGISREDALLRINAQKPEEYYRERSDIIIRNYPPFELDDEIKGLIEYVRKRET
jgi:dephospho-CoA kinase